MEAWDAIRARRNVRSYLPDPVPQSDLDRIAEAGWRAPSASNRQHWDFIIVTDRRQLEDLSTVWRGAGHIAGAPAAIALVVPEPPDDRTRFIDQYDLGQATLAMTIARPTWASGPAIRRWATRTGRATYSAYPTITSSRISWASAIRQTAH